MERTGGARDSGPTLRKKEGWARANGALEAPMVAGSRAKGKGKVNEVGAAATPRRIQALQGFPVDNAAILQGILQTLTQISQCMEQLGALPPQAGVAPLLGGDNHRRPTPEYIIRDQGRIRGPVCNPGEAGGKMAEIQEGGSQKRVIEEQL